MSREVKRMDIREFRELGYLQELNRRFLHPLGLALEVIVDDEDDSVRLGGVWDFREDLEGIRFAISMDEDRTKELAEYMLKAKLVYHEEQAREAARREALGYWIQPLTAEALALPDPPAGGAS